MKIYTSYYAQLRNFKKEGITPIAISLGIPKFLRAEQMDRIFLLAPSRDMLGLPYDIYKERYIEKLEKVDWKFVHDMISKKYGDKPVALLCYEALKTEGEFCHRTMLAEYINEKYSYIFGQVTEWKKEEKAVSQQIGMFDDK
jgi:hypothetical protein